MIEERAFEPMAYLLARQPIGELYFVVFPASVLVKISYADRRELVEEYLGGRMFLGVQRQLSEKRVKEIREYVGTTDATFPGSVILSIDERCIRVNEGNGTLELHPAAAEPEFGLEEIPAEKIARIIDGQHRIEGLKDQEIQFDVPATLFIGADEASEAGVFSTVNLAQTKVNRSLAIDLLELAKTRSPQKTAHNIAVALDSTPEGPFGGRIKRLGVATEGRDGETITQATFVDALVRLITRNAVADRETYRRGKKIAVPSRAELEKTPLRGLFAADKDLAIARGMDAYFRAVRDRWPGAWSRAERGAILGKTAGYRALMRLWGTLIRRWEVFEDLPPEARYAEVLGNIALSQEYFETDIIGYGSGAEATLYMEFTKQFREEA
jgi:DGQHR domain-containing protein